MSEPNKIDALCSEFEEAWTADIRSDLSNWLEKFESLDKSQLLEKLVSVDIELRMRAGLSVDANDYAEHGSNIVDFAAVERNSIQDNSIANRTIMPSSDSVFGNAKSTNQKKIGPYYLLEPIGEGGMGSVWKAEQREPVQRIVALKVIRDGLGSKEIIARFEAERQALTMMDHPSIAKVLDVGQTESGSPYFVMELVNGMAINEYCDQFKLGIHERLALMIQVCQAVQHAHQKGIIHRDLKPSNVLVGNRDGQSIVKVIDFGLAKALEHSTRLTDKTMATEFGQVLGTLQYMSPEQAGLNSQDIDTRTDVYSLGVMLYELLTGSTPLEKKTMADKALFNLLQHICDSETPKPSDRLSSTAVAKTSSIASQRKIAPTRLRTILRGELDWIVMKALEKDRRQRFATATELADDMHRFLNNEPVEARPPSASYNLKKFVSKNKVPVGAACLVVGALVAGIVSSTSFSIAATSAKNRAVESENVAKRETDRAKEALEEADVATKKAVKSERVAATEATRAKKALASSRYVVANLRKNQGRVNEALRLLDEIPVEFRDVEWYLSRREISGSDFTLNAHEGTVNAIAIGDNRDWFASAGNDQRVVIWEVLTGNSLRETDFGQAATDIAISPDGNLLAVAGFNSIVRVLKVSTLEIVSELKEANFQAALVFDKDNSSVSFLDSKTGISHWDFTKLVLKTSDSTQASVNSSNDFLTYSNDGTQLRYSNQFGVYSFDRKAKRKDTLISDKTRTTKLPFAFSPSGKHFAHAENSGPMGREDRIRIVDVSRNKVSSTESDRLSTKPIKDIQFSPDGDLIAAIRGNEIHAWSLSNTVGLGGYRQISFMGHSSEVTALAFIPDGRRIISGSTNGTIKIWSRDNKQRAKLHLGGNPIKYLAANENPFEIVAGDGGFENRISTAPLRVEEKVSAINSFANGSERGWISLRINRDLELEIVRVGPEAGQETTLVHTTVEVSDPTIFSVDPTGRFATIASPTLDHDEDEIVQLPLTLYDLHSGKILTTLAKTDASEKLGIEIGSTLFSSDGGVVAFAVDHFDNQDAEFSSVEIWDTNTLAQVATLKLSEPSLALEFDLNAERLFVMQSEQILAWSTKDWTPTAVVKTGTAALDDSDQKSRIKLSKTLFEPAGSMKLHPSGNRLAVAVEDSILLVTLESGEEVVEIDAEAFVEDLQWSPDGTLLFAALNDGTLNVWNASEKDGGFQAEKSSIDAYWHANMADDAEKRNDWFSAIFHRAWLLKSKPANRLAWCLLHDAHEKLETRHANSALPPLPQVVNQMLALKFENLDSDVDDDFGLPDHEIILDLESRLVAKENWHESVRPRFDLAVLQAIDKKNAAAQTVLALLEFRLGNFDNAIEYVNDAKGKGNRNESKESPIELAVLALSSKASGKKEAADKYSSLFQKAMEQSKHMNNDNAKQLYIELFGATAVIKIAERTKASRGSSFGLKPAVWPARVPQSSLVNNLGGGVF